MKREPYLFYVSKQDRVAIQQVLFQVRYFVSGYSLLFIARAKLLYWKVAPWGCVSSQKPTRIGASVPHEVSTLTLSKPV